MRTPSKSSVRAVEAAADGPTGDWRVDIERPPLGSVVSMLFRVLVERLERHIDAAGMDPIRPSYLYVLRALYPDPLSVTALAQECDVTKQAISQILAGMESADLVTRTDHHTDGRTKIVKLTKNGEKALATAVRSWGRVEKDWAELIGGSAMGDLREAMLAFIEAHGDWHPGEQPHLARVW